jgi:hypothetical protein
MDSWWKLAATTAYRAGLSPAFPSTIPLPSIHNRSNLQGKGKIFTR